MTTNLNLGTSSATTCSLHHVSMIYNQCITITGTQKRDCQMRHFLSLYAGFTLYALLNETRMDKHKFVTTLLDDTLDFLVTFNLAQARRSIRIFKKGAHSLSVQKNELEQLVEQFNNAYIDSTLDGSFNASNTLNEYMFMRMWDYVFNTVN